MKLNNIADNKGARTARTRVGRGTGSGKGTRAGRGDKGQKSRSGVAIKGFEGGQMPIYRRLPKRGFKNPFSKDFNEVNIGRLQEAIDAKKLDAKKPITIDVLLASGIITKRRDGVRVLGKGELKANVTLEVSGASKAAIDAVEKAGGTVSIVAAAAKTEKPAKADSKKPAKADSKKSEEQDSA
jgi:large subunit ribosomal protein L15